MNDDKPVWVRRLSPGEGSVWRSAVKILVPAADRDNELVSVSEAELAIADARCYMIVAENESELVGLLSAYRFPDVEAGGQLVYLYDIEVNSARRRRGFGRAMIGFLLETCDADDVDMIWAGTERGNTSARTLFERTGATLEGENYAEYEWDLED